MARPSNLDIEKKQKELDKFLKKLADPVTGKQKPTAIINLVRGAIRAAWMVSPAKLAYFEMGRLPDNDPTARKWKMECEYCKREYNTDVIEIDHRFGNHTFSKPEDFVSYHDNILDIEFADLQRLCKYRCHSVKSHMEGQDHEDMCTAAVSKINIFLVKHMDTKEYTKWLRLNDIAVESTAPKRKAQGFALLMDMSLDETDMLDLFEACDLMLRLQKKVKTKRFAVKPAEKAIVQRFLDVWDKEGLFEPKTILTAYKQ